MHTEIAVAVIAAVGLVGSAFVGYFSAQRETRRHERQVDDTALAKREQLVWDQANKFWQERAESLSTQVKLERAAREADATALKADVALLRNDNAQLKASHEACEQAIKRLEGLVNASNQLKGEPNV